MLKKILIFVCVCVFLSANDEKFDDSIEFIRTLSQPESTQIESISDEKGEILATFSNLSLVKGESGIVMRDLEVYQALVGNMEIVEVDGTKAVGKFSKLTQLSQPYLPTPRLKAEVGDKVSFRNFNNKAFVIAPNEATYRHIIDKYGKIIDFINPDLLMGFLNSQGKHDPTDKRLIAACSEYAAGLVFIVGSKNLAIFSCGNMAMLKKYPFTPLNSESFQAPFYTRAKFEGGGSLTYLFASKKSRQYYQYYDIMIGDLIDEKAKK
ncbi:plasminogen-binding protein pgbA [Helicobacter saguini]|uniref:Plasminogen-binding protein pgbA n=1 Tax=Helicobacter saguini TaxID=1548018 RepID=A0A347VGI4_9HELI|nr:plasminogen-binding N-terminal domain-containing protein [Helicobacter saguini]MWV61909.1 plasminogen-binding protein pgbA [Helicobacter saguini]MWV67416.1 plasminogen-binding protein pgbA [Helicobacter saguini]MWV69769.1 plasminogen-binding protein pgbA [Helicobacter saguini]MWV73014.1 plasminogen-binding protein pgbA [Helicobacter saguini]TLD95608.1 plasminogen-binding protein pgbA [Helicobacter saguini]